MKRLLSLLSFLSLCAPLLAADAPAPAIILPDRERDGRELAARIRNARPEKDSEFKGKLVIQSREDKVTEIPITSKITIGSTNWTVVYRTPGETLTIGHRADQPNTYELSLGTNAPATKLLGDAQNRPLAGSDFWALDLGLEFFHWPRQRKLTNEVRNSRSCHVLESLNPDPASTSYARVLSWIDVETSGIIRAEAYDRSQKLIKEFKIGSLRKVDGQRQLESMKIRSPKTGQDTELKFDLLKVP